MCIMLRNSITMPSILVMTVCLTAPTHADETQHNKTSENITLENGSILRIIDYWSGNCEQSPSGSDHFVINEKYEFEGSIDRGYLNCGKLRDQNDNFYQGCFYNNLYHAEGVYISMHATSLRYKVYLGTFCKTKKRGEGQENLARKSIFRGYLNFLHRL